jgi:glutathione S-transferase
MQLVGMLDSPYVRRAAITLRLLGVPFEHKSVSVLRQIEEFSRISPVLKVPTLVLDDGRTLLDSTLIIDYAACIAGPGAPALLPAEPAARVSALRAVGLALAACEKTVQIVYEHRLRPEDKRHGPWVDRVQGQLLAACRELEGECASGSWAPADADEARLGQAGISAAVAWTFMRFAQPQVVDAADFPHLAAWAERAEALPALRAYPHPSLRA